ncbi:DUF5082 domain-containing protein [Metabacillus litoralis]|uniref:DUF5082 domain-containing protein n=1 Tax=Metabacillus litoralis TaxID=152268 RepID=A0A5C6W1H0_9BACI|nr:DUF5082 family protein [Metabacillus litoralis]TXC89528.1 DUF5082 domain-containing protein [Metabacillus litoralis]
MSLSSALYAIQRTISSQSNDLDEKIDRLRKAKNDINREQGYLLQEIAKLKQPDLGKEWVGKRANEYDDEREEAYSIMRKIGNVDYDGYQQLIENKINSLEMERSVLSFTQSLAYEAGRLVGKGEEAADELSDRINDLRRRLF